MTHADSIWIKVFEAHTDSLQSKVDLLQAKFDDLQGKTEFLSNVVETANDGVNNQLSAANNLLALVAVIMAVVGIWLGIYIAKKKRQIEMMAAIVEAKKKTVEQLAEIVDEKKGKVDIIAKAIEDLDKKIHSDLSGLYKDLRKEETNALLERLILEPQDIDNLCTILCARDIDEKGYEKLRTAYLKMKKMLNESTIGNVANDCSEQFFVLFYQHFFCQALNDDEILPDLEDYYGVIFDRAYKRDMIKSTIDLCKALSEKTFKFDKENTLTTYLKALNSSQYSKLTELKNIFEQIIVPQTLLQNAIENCKKENIKLVIFEDNPTEKEEAKN